MDERVPVHRGAPETKITRAPCTKRTGAAILRAENFGDLITADHKVRSEESESRNNHRYAVVVQDLSIRRIQSYPCKTKTSQETEKSLRKFLEPTRKPKVIYTDNSLEFGKSCEDLSWNHCTSTPHTSGTNRIAERAERRVKEGTSAVLLQPGLDEKWWYRFHGLLLLSAKHSRSLVWWENISRTAIWRTIEGTNNSVWSTSSVRKFYLEYSSVMPCGQETFGRRH